MAYAAFSVVFGEQPSAAKWNILGSNDASFNDGTGIFGLKKDLLTTDSNPYKFSAYRTAAYNSVATTDTVFPYDTELFDTNNNFDSTTNKGRYTAPVSGFYEFNAHYSHSAGSISLGYIALRVNGTEKARGNDIRTAMVNMGIGVNKLLQLSANDYVEVNYYMSAASAVDVTSSAANYFTGFLVSRT